MLSKFFGHGKKPVQTTPDVGHGGLIGFYGLSQWYETLSDEEKALVGECS
jgi:hypothetical protein